MYALVYDLSSQTTHRTPFHGLLGGVPCNADLRAVPASVPVLFCVLPESDVVEEPSFSDFTVVVVSVDLFPEILDFFFLGTSDESLQESSQDELTFSI